MQSVGEKHRKSHGQFFTPLAVAEWMVEWVLKSGVSELYDPAFGLGVFGEAASTQGAVEFAASEIDAEILAFYSDEMQGDASVVTREDYLLSWGRRHTNIVCNPPYMKFQQFLNRGEVAELFAQHTGTKLPGHLNTASAFLLKSLSEMNGRGRLAYIMPLEFLNSGYGKLVKSKLIEGGHLHSILRFDCEKELFPDATTSVGILLYDASFQHSAIKFYSVRNLEELENFSALSPIRSVALEALDPATKWQSYFREDATFFHREQMVELSHYGRFRRGIATGANSYFVMRQSQATARGLSERDCVACITRSAQIKQPVFTQRDLQSLLDSDDPLLLFSPQSAPSAAAWKYIEFGESVEIQNAFLTSHRKPWYKSEFRPSAPLLLGVFSRGGYKVILNQSQALNLTCYHGFQSNVCGENYVERLFLYLSSATGRRVLTASGRKYGGNLDKFEPNDLNTSLVPNPEFFDSISDGETERAVADVQRTGNIPRRVEEIFARLNNDERPKFEPEAGS